MDISRRYTLRTLGALSASAAACTFLALPARATPPAPVVEVWKSPTCGCCKDWINYLKANGFNVKPHDTGNTAMRKQLGMPEKYGSCHTARIQGYVLEGHVPAREIRRLLQEKPNALGLSVPDMPIGSPGMDGPEYGGRKDRYNVMLVNRDGSASIYQRY